MVDNNLLFRLKDLVDNPTARIPICLCLDTSGSMGAVEGDYEEDTGKTVFEDGQEWRLVTGGTSRIGELNKGIQLFYDAIREDETAKYAAEICIVTFDNTAKCIVDFANIDRQTKIPELQATGETAMGEGVNLALDLLEKRKDEYKDSGVDYYQPWLVIMTDGVAEDTTVYQQAAARTANAVRDKKLTVFPISIGNETNKSALQDFSPKRPPLKLQGLKFKEFFIWLSQSVSRTSQSVPGDAIRLDQEGIKGWGEL